MLASDIRRERKEINRFLNSQSLSLAWFQLRVSNRAGGR